jgi:hypothetical protein
VYTALDRGRAEGTINILNTGRTVPGKPPTPSRFSSIQAMPDETTRGEWYRAHYSENDGLFDKPDVLRAVPLPPGVPESDLMRLHTIYTIKSDGRKKARTVLGCGKAVVDNLDLGYDRSFSPTARASTVRICCALAAELDLVIRGGDATQAYGQADWPTHVKKLLAAMPAGYHKYYDGHMYCCEVGNLYGHPIAGRNRYNTLRQRMTKRGYIQSEHDPCLFCLRHGDELIIILVYVDDILTFTTRDSQLYDEWEKWFTSKFEWTNFGTDLHEYTSIRIRQLRGSVTLDMERYIDDMKFEHFPAGIHHAYSTPAETDLAKVVHKAKLAKDTTHAQTPLAKRFRRLTMQILYCALQTRPDVLIAANLLTRVQAYATPDLLLRAERILIYLIGTKDYAITYSRTGDVKPKIAWAPRTVVTGMSDATWDMAHSTTGYVFSVANAAAVWATLLQKSIALNTMESEVVAGSQAACEAIHIRGLLGDVGLEQTEPTVLYMDSTSAINLAEDPMYHSTAKHIARRDLFIRTLCADNVIKPKYIATSANVADALTKPLTTGPFRVHRAALLGHA